MGEEANRDVHVNYGVNHPINKRYPNNLILTAKYTVWNFLPVNLFEQFRRIANFYFLALVIVHASIETSASFTSFLIPLIMVVGVTSVKQAYEDILRHRGDALVNNARVTVLRDCQEKDALSKEVRVGDVVKVRQNETVPCDIVLLTSSEPNGVCHVTTANLDGETNLKTLRCPRVLKNLRPDELYEFRAHISCEPPNSSLYTFHGKLEITSADSSHLDANNLLLRGVTIKNTSFVYGCAIYTGHHTKLMMNTKIKRNKFSTAERSVNKFLIFIFSILLVEISVCTLLKYFLEKSTWFERHLSYLGVPLHESSAGLQVLQDVLSFLVLFTYLVPIALYASLELQNVLGSLYFGWDEHMYCEEIDECAISNTSDLNEELGQVRYLLTDKTGTLTENEMVLRNCSVNGECLSASPELTAEVETFLIAIAVCHSGNNPDEEALIQAADRFGVSYTGDSCGDMMQFKIVRQQDEQDSVQYRRLETIEFTSERRRMSVVVEDPFGQVWLICKGAECAVLPLCIDGPVAETRQHVQTFAREGLRTLVVGRRALSSSTWNDLRVSLNEARQVMCSSYRDSALSAICNSLESSLTLLGATGVEDRLQKGVMDTLESLREAGMKVWILTGDKVETAINVSLSSGHIKTHTIQLTLTGITDPDQCKKQLIMFKHLLTSQLSFDDFCLVLDGDTLALALDYSHALLQEVAVTCTSVLACRLTPLQKSQLVQLVKTSRGHPVTASVGDGANDVSMIQEANVGIGIMGKEGRQAVRSSDFSVPKFRHLSRVFLVHGHWYYVRVANLVMYFFYKSPAFISPQLFFTLNCLYSTQELYTALYLVCYNLFYAAIPVIAYGLFEQDMPATTLLEKPQLYKSISSNQLFAVTRFLAWFTNGVWHAAILYYGSYAMVGASLLQDGSDAGVAVLGSAVAHNVVLVTNMKLLITSRFWSAPFLVSILVSLLLFMGITLLGDFDRVYAMLLGSPSFWLLSLVVSVACLLPDLAYEAWKNIFILK